jgi:hypothetical protein
MTTASMTGRRTRNLDDVRERLRPPHPARSALVAAWVVAASGAAEAATVGAAVGPGVGLEEADRAALRERLAAALTERGHEAVAVVDVGEGCAAEAACATGVADQAHADAVVFIDVLRAGDDAEVTEVLAGKDGRELARGTASVPWATLLGAPLLDDVANAVGALPPTKSTEPPPAPTPKGDGRVGLGIAVRGDIALLHARTFGVTIDEASLANTLTGDGGKGAGGGALVQLSWMVPLPGSSWNRRFGVEFDVGYNVTTTNGTIPFTQYASVGGTTKLVTTNYEYSSVLHVVPLSLGARSRLPLELPVHLDVAAGAAALWGLSIASAKVSGSDVAFATDNSSSDVAWGFYVEGDVTWELGPGELVGGYRYTSAYLDFEHPEENPGPGDLGGHHLLLGYRFTL